jgi:hypothetical protein
MRYFEANDELAEILLNHGFIETTPERDKKKGKKRFKTSKNGSKEIYFDYIDIKILSRSIVQTSDLRFSEYDLKLILLFMKMKSTDYSEIDFPGSFNLSKAKERIDRIQDELSYLKEISFRKSRQGKLSRILETLNTIEVSP